VDVPDANYETPAEQKTRHEPIRLGVVMCPVSHHLATRDHQRLSRCSKRQRCR